MAVRLVEKLAIEPDHRLDGVTRRQDELDHVHELRRAVVEWPDRATARPLPHTRRAHGGARSTRQDRSRFESHSCSPGSSMSAASGASGPSRSSGFASSSFERVSGPTRSSCRDRRSSVAVSFTSGRRSGSLVLSSWVISDSPWELSDNGRRTSASGRPPRSAGALQRCTSRSAPRDQAVRMLRRSKSQAIASVTAAMAPSAATCQTWLVEPRSIRSCRSWMPCVTGKRYASARTGGEN